jgi:transaldolase
MIKKSSMERFNETSEELEIWWDSSPLVFDSWKKARVKSKPFEERDAEEELLERYYISERPMEQLFRGVTTNPPLSGAVVKDDPGFWQEWVIEKKRTNPRMSTHEVWWEVYKEIVKRGAEKYLGVFRQSGHRMGYISGQVDPRDYENEEEMRRQGEELASLCSNVMIKIPGTREGVDVLRYLTSKGVATNCTLAFVMPQFVTVEKAVSEGLEEAKRKGLNLGRWRSVITSMTGRYEELGSFDAEAEKLGIEISVAEKRWASIAIFKKAMAYMKEKGSLSKMLICSMRPGPGTGKLWHFEKLSGAPAVFTCPPKYINEVDKEFDGIEYDPEGWKEPVPEKVFEKLNMFQYFREAYEPKGLEPDQFNTHPATLATAKSFSKATNEMESFVEQSLKTA